MTPLLNTSTPPEAPLAIPLSHEVAELDIAILDPDPGNPRGNEPGGDLEGLAASIGEAGLLAPIRVRPSDVPGRFIITYGFRRVEATKLAGKTKILCLIDRQPADPIRLLKEQIAENLHRQDIPAIAFARALKRLQDEADYTLAQLAEAIKKDLSFVSRKLSLLKFSQEVQDAIAGAASGESAFVEIAKIRNSQAREELAERAIRKPMTKEQAAESVASLDRRRRSPRAPASRPLKRLSLRLGDMGAVLAITCPDGLPELTTEIIRDGLEFALREVRKALAKAIPAAELAAHFQKRRDAQRKAAVTEAAAPASNGQAAVALAPAANAS